MKPLKKLKTLKKRLDILVVERGLAESRQRAQAMILAGEIRVNQQAAPKAGAQVALNAQIELSGSPLLYASRGGLKLEGALDDFAIAPAGLICMDVGSSTGGFTDCLLQRGATRVYAVDVGKGQLEWKLRNDPRVVVMEGINAREGVTLPELVDLIVADVSFISLRLVLPPSLPHLRESGDVVAMVKPQFEAGREAVGRGGIVREIAPRVDAVVAVAERLNAQGVPVIAVVPSRLPGREGNREIFVHARRGGTALPADELRAAAERSSS